jgi:UDP-N-acetylmuramoylalanine--D-glutamate ligase
LSYVPGEPFPLSPGQDLSGLNATVMGLGRFSGGIETVRWLCARGARVTVTDLAGEEKLARSLAEIADLDVKLRLGGHEERDFTGADLVVASPAVPPESNFLAAAAKAGVPLMTELSLTMSLLRCRTALITGTCGKSTTTALLGRILGAGGVPSRVGGNIGRSLLNDAEQMEPTETAVIEVSSFQLEWLERDGLRPDLAVITNVTPNHLDRHGTFERYLEAKAAVLPDRGPVVLCADDPVCRDRIGPRAGAHRHWTSLEAVPDQGAYFKGGLAIRRSEDGEEVLFESSDLRLVGSFNRMNALQAATAARLLGAPPEAVRSALVDFAGLPHRLQAVGERDGIRGVNDSKATTPEAAVRALQALDAPLVLIAGGFERGAELSEFARAIREKVKSLIVLGEASERLAEELAGWAGRISGAGSIEEAVDLGLALAEPGDTLLLSPGHASWDMFSTYEERGERFTSRFVGE